MKYLVKLVSGMPAPTTAFIFAFLNPSAGKSFTGNKYLTFAVMYEFSRSVMIDPLPLMHTVVKPGLSTGVLAAYDAEVTS